MKKIKTKWVKHNSPLYKQLEAAKILGANSERGAIFKILMEHFALTDDFVEWLFTEKFPMNEDQQHLEKCESCRSWSDPIYDLPYCSWYCTPCDRLGYGYGCPEHAHVEDKSVVV